MLSIKIMRAAQQVIKAEYDTGAMASMGVSKEDWDRLTQKRMWTLQDRVTIQRVLMALRDGLAAAQGFTPFRTPAEYLAALINGFVHPINWRAACSWTAAFPQQPAVDEAAGVVLGSSEEVTDSQLFALCTMAHTNDEQFVAQFESKVHKEQERMKKQ